VKSVERSWTNLWLFIRMLFEKDRAKVDEHFS